MIWLLFFAFCAQGVLSEPLKQFSSKYHKPLQKGYVTQPEFNNIPQLSSAIQPLPSFQETLPSEFLAPQIIAQNNPQSQLPSEPLPSIKARLNQHAFEYISSLLPPILDHQIKQARIPPVSTCPPLLEGCVQVSNIFVSRYRCPQHVSLSPSPPDQLVIIVQNLDLGVTGNLGGYIKILKRKLFGIVQVNAHQVSITVAIKITKSQNGGPIVEMVDCQVTVGIVDAYIEHGGILGIIANKIFREIINKQAKDMIPGKVCETIPTMINEKLNSRLAAIKRNLALTQLLKTIGGPLDFTNPSYDDGCGNPCRVASAGKSQKIQKPLKLFSSNGTSRGKRSAPYAKPLDPLPKSKPANLVVLRGSQQLTPRNKNSFGVYTAEEDQKRRQQFAAKARAHAANIQFVEPGELSPCLSCGGTPAPPSPFCQFKQFLALLDPRKLNGIVLSIDFLKTFATSQDFSLDLNGVFFAGQNDYPFEGYPMEFPRKHGIRMAEALINEYTVNTLLHSLTKNGFFAFAVGPGTPKIGTFLKTTCNDDPADYGIEDEIEQQQKTRSLLSILHRSRSRREATSFQNALASFGVCLGDLLPQLKQFYPNQNIIIQIYLEQDPILALTSMRGGTAILDLVGMADFLTESGANLGSLRIKAGLEAKLHFGNNEILGHAELVQFRISNPDGLFGISQIALDKVAEIGQAILERTMNEMLQNGIPFQISTSDMGIPIELIEPQIKIIDHAIHFESDFALTETLWKELSGEGQGNCRR